MAYFREGEILSLLLQARKLRLRSDAYPAHKVYAAVDTHVAVMYRLLRGKRRFKGVVAALKFKAAKRLAVRLSRSPYAEVRLKYRPDEHRSRKFLHVERYVRVAEFLYLSAEKAIFNRAADLVAVRMVLCVFYAALYAARCRGRQAELSAYLQEGKSRYGYVQLRRDQLRYGDRSRTCQVNAEIAVCVHLRARVKQRLIVHKVKRRVDALYRVRILSRKRKIALHVHARVSRVGQIIAQRRVARVTRNAYREFERGVQMHRAAEAEGGCTRFLRLSRGEGGQSGRSFLRAHTVCRSFRDVFCGNAFGKFADRYGFHAHAHVNIHVLIEVTQLHFRALDLHGILADLDALDLARDGSLAIGAHAVKHVALLERFERFIRVFELIRKTLFVGFFYDVYAVRKFNFGDALLPDDEVVVLRLIQVIDRIAFKIVDRF